MHRSGEKLQKAVEHALVSQGLLIWAGLEPTAAPGLLKAADLHRRAAARIVDELQAHRRPWGPGYGGAPQVGHGLEGLGGCDRQGESG